MNDNDRLSAPLTLRTDQDVHSQIRGDQIEHSDRTDELRLQYECIELIHQLKTQVEEIDRKLSGQVKEFYTVNEVASLLDREPGTVRRWIRKGKLRAQRVRETGPKGQWLVSREALKDLLDSGFDAEVPGLNAPDADSVDAVQPSANRIAGSTEQGAA